MGMTDGAEDIEQVRSKRDRFYAERHQLTAALVRYWQRDGYAVALEPSTKLPSVWTLYVQTPAGQLSWHVPDVFLALYGELPRFAGAWDGHSTDEKYERLKRLPISPLHIGR